MGASRGDQIARAAAEEKFNPEMGEKRRGADEKLSANAVEIERGFRHWPCCFCPAFPCP